ncbi:SEC14 cytosolic factor (Phosphatidylinositol/phosphatidylcholine transfer protein) (PI/PC TP), partial [Durusdinium trenchii]
RQCFQKLRTSFARMTCCWGFIPGRNVSTPRSEAITLSAEHKAKLSEFRKFIDDEAVKDYDLLRFLRARRWDVAAAVLQYQDTCQWREEHHIDELRAKALGPQGLFSCQELDQETVSALFSGGVEKFPFLRLVNQREDEGAWLFFGMAVSFGVDKEGRPIHLQKAGVASHRFAQMYSFAGDNPAYNIIYDGYVRMQELQAARMQESSDRMGKRVTQQVVIMDFKGLSFWPDPRAIAVFKDFLMVSQKYYPETLAIQFFLNTPPIFMAIWRLIKDWIDPVTAKKMHLLGSDFHSELLEYIHADQLPVEYGGTNPFDVFDWPQNLDEYRRRYALCQRAAEKLPGRKQLKSSFSAKPVVESKRSQNSQRVWAVLALLLSVLVTFVRVL